MLRCTLHHSPHGISGSTSVPVHQKRDHALRTSKSPVVVWAGSALLAFHLINPASAQDASASDVPAASGGEVPVETSGLAMEPISGDDAALDSAGASEVAGFSEEYQKRFLPEALFLRLALGGVYDDNIFQSEFHKEHDIVMQGQLGLAFKTPTAGNSSFSANYDVTSFWYLDHPDFDAINQSANFNGGLTLGKTQLGLSASYQRVEGGEQLLLNRSSFSNPSKDNTSGVTNQNTSSSDQEVGQFSVRDIVAGSLSASRELASKTSLNSSINFSGTYYQENQYQDSEDLSARLGVSYQITGKTSLGLAGVAGQLKNGSNATQTYQKLLLTAGYNATGKLVFNGEAGVEFRQYGRRTVKQIVAVPTLPVVKPVVVSEVTPAPAAQAKAPAAAPPSGSAGIELPATPETTTGTGPTAAAAAPPPEASQNQVARETSSSPEPSPVNDYSVTEVETEENDTTRFVFNLQASYQIRVRTLMRLSAARSTEGSAVAGGSSIERTTFSLGLDQALGRRFAAGLTGGYELSAYREQDTSQDYLFGRATLNFQPTATSSIGLFYEYRNNDAGENGITYEANRFGVQCAISF